MPLQHAQCLAWHNPGARNIERFIRTMKDECFRRIVVPLGKKAFMAHASSYSDWYNRFRPHTAPAGRTPEERYRRVSSACRRPRFEPRPGWPIGSPCAFPPAKVRGRAGVCLKLAVDYHHGRKHLPVVTLKPAA